MFSYRGKDKNINTQIRDATEILQLLYEKWLNFALVLKYLYHAIAPTRKIFPTHPERAWNVFCK
jgi:hypothetical protein